MRALLLALIMLGALPMGGARAEPFRPGMKALDDTGFASDVQLRQAVGNLSIEVVCPARRGAGTARLRGAHVTLADPGTGWRTPAVLSRILLIALQQMWNECPRALGSFGFSVGFAEIYAPQVAGAAPMLMLRAEQFLEISRTWSRLQDVEYERRAAEEEAERRVQEAARQAAVEAEQRAQEAAALVARIKAQEEQERLAREKAARAAAERERLAAEGERMLAEAGAYGWTALQWILWIGVPLWLFRKRATLVRWYYLLTPHPAARMVDAAIRRGVEIDGATFAHIMRPVPGNRVGMQVRASQATTLAERAHRHAEELRVEAERLHAEAKQASEFVLAQEKLLDATSAHERVRARLDTLRKLVGST